MATNPMQRKSRNSFLLGVVITLLIAAVIVVLLYMKIQDQQEELDEYKLTTQSVYILNQDVESGQALTANMFTLSTMPTTSIPSDSTTDVASLLSAYSLTDTTGMAINTGADSTGTYYFFSISNSEDASNAQEYIIYTTDSSGNEQVARSITVDDSSYYYYYADGNNKTEVTIASSAVVAKVDMKANTVITQSLITRSDERTTNDLRTVEYNVISLPIDLITGEYVDIRLSLPDGQDYIVVSKKSVTVPISAGVYVEDAIQMNLTEKEILYLSCAIYENYTMEGSKLYATKYTDPGVQATAEVTYYPSNEVIQIIENNANIVDKAIEGIKDRREDINNSLNEYGDEDNVSSEVEESITSTLEERKTYLQSLTTTTTE